MLNITSHLDGSFQSALRHHQAGHLAEAERVYRHILRQNPQHVEALHMLGVLTAQMQRHDEAVELLHRALAVKPDLAPGWCNLGKALVAGQRHGEAVAAFRKAIALSPDLLEAHFDLGDALKHLGLPHEAEQVLKQARGFGSPDQLMQAAARYHRSGRRAEAETLYQRILEQDPRHVNALLSLTMLASEANCRERAEQLLRQVIALQPDSAMAHNNLGNMLAARGALEEAIREFQQAIASAPGVVEPQHNLATALQEKGALDGAITAYRHAIATNPKFVRSYDHLCNALRQKGDLDAAVQAARQAIALNPNYPEAHIALGNTLAESGQVEEAMAAYRQARRIRPDSMEASSNILLTLHYSAAHTPEVIAEEHRQWGRQFAGPLKKFIQPHTNDHNPERRLKIGYVSPDFRDHAVAPMVLPLIEHHDRAQFEVFCYSQLRRPDAWTDTFRRHADHWRDTMDWPDQEMADAIRQDGIDILIDLAGHTLGNRLLVFARKPAPVQVSRQGYPNTTGVDTINYRITDALADPPGVSDQLHVERLVRLPVTNWIYQPPEHAPPAKPFDPDRPITFGCFNNFPKVTPGMLQVWARVLAGVPNSRLLLKARPLGAASVRQRVLSLFAAHGITAERVELVAWCDTPAEHLQMYDRMTIALDAFPYHGTTTTCEALWMGVPVITLAGQTHVSRVGVSLLHNMGLPELIAATPEEYVRIAVELASNRNRLAELHATLRQKMQSSPLMDYAAFVRHIEQAYRTMWRTWCAGMAS